MNQMKYAGSDTLAIMTILLLTANRSFTSVCSFEIVIFNSSNNNYEVVALALVN